MKLALLLSSLILSACASTQVADNTPAKKAGGEEALVVADNSAVENKDKVRCTQEKTTGSNLRKKHCFTEEERKEMRDASVEALRKQNRGTGLPVKQ